MRHSKTLASVLLGMGWTAIIGGVALIPSWLAIALIVLGWVLIIAGVVVWRKDEPESPPSSLDRLRAVLARGIELRTYVLLEGAGAYENEEGKVVGGDSYRITQHEPLFKWAREAWEVVRKHFPEYAKEFYGEDYKLGSPYLMYAFSREVNREGRDAYLERLIALLERIIDRASNAPKS